MLASRVRLARNLRDVPFRGAIAPSAARELCERVRRHADGVLPGLAPLADETSLDAGSLSDRLRVPSNLLSPDDPGPWLALEERERGLLVLDGDHLRPWARTPGLDLPGALERIATWEEALQESFRLARDPDWGWRTASPGDVGTGLRASVLLHLPALWLSRALGAAADALDVLGLRLGDPWGGDPEASGGLCVLANRRTLGRPEIEILREVTAGAERLRDEERRATEVLSERWGLELSDAVRRSDAVLGSAALLSDRELTSRCAFLALGARLGELPGTAGRDALLLRLETREASLKAVAGAAWAEAHPQLDDLRAREAARVWRFLRGLSPAGSA